MIPFCNILREMESRSRQKSADLGRRLLRSLENVLRV